MGTKYTDFGALCREHRTKQKLTMTAAAEKLEKTQPYISGVENGKIPLTIEFVKKCIEVYGLKGSEKFEFLIQALRESKEIKIPLNEVSVVPKEKFMKLLAALLLNEKTEFIHISKDILSNVQGYR
jgi:transcriptional regulator with XRE-family HTH domain